MTTQDQSLSLTERVHVLIAGFLGWMFAGIQLGITSIVMRDAAKDLLGTNDVATIGQWFGWLTGTFMLGAALGGYMLGWIGDRLGRRVGMALSIACYSIAAGISGLADSPVQLLIARCATGLGVGGMWPNGIALVAEAWPRLSRPMLAGVIGTAANIGIMLFSILTCFVFVTPNHWRWAMYASFASLLLAAYVVTFVPESVRWRKAQNHKSESKPVSPLIDVFRPPLLKLTLVGIALGTVPLFGGWGNSNWANAWAAEIGDQQTGKTFRQTTVKLEQSGDTKSGKEKETNKSDPALKARAVLARSAPGSLASLLGGAIATWVGKHRFYFLLSCACFSCAQMLFWHSHPASPDFLWWTAALGLFSGFYFGWLPLYLPELFPTRVRSTGAGVCFNFGRVGTAIGILGAAALLKNLFDGDYAAIGRLTSWIYAAGAVVIFFAPDTRHSDLDS